MSSFTPNQIMQALMAIAPDTAIRFANAAPEAVPPWYVVTPGVEIKDGGVLKSTGAHGMLPHTAVIETWVQVTTDLKPHQYLVINAADPDRRRAVRWNGFMWADVIEPKGVTR